MFSCQHSWCWKKEEWVIYVMQRVWMPSGWVKPGLTDILRRWEMGIPRVHWNLNWRFFLIGKYVETICPYHQRERWPLDWAMCPVIFDIGQVLVRFLLLLFYTIPESTYAPMKKQGHPWGHECSEGIIWRTVLSGDKFSRGKVQLVYSVQVQCWADVWQ